MNESLMHEMWTYVASLCALFIFVADIRKITTKFHCVGYMNCKYQLFVQFVVHSVVRFHLQFDKPMNISTILMRRLMRSWQIFCFFLKKILVKHMLFNCANPMTEYLGIERVQACTC